MGNDKNKNQGEEKKTGRGTGHKGRAKGSHTWHDHEMDGTQNLTGEGAKKRGEAMTKNLSATERAKRKDDPKK